VALRRGSRLMRRGSSLKLMGRVNPWMRLISMALIQKDKEQWVLDTEALSKEEQVLAIYLEVVLSNKTCKLMAGVILLIKVMECEMR
jgi:hypothetical protein